MKNFKHLCLLLTALAFAACSNDEIVTPEPDQQPADEGHPTEELLLPATSLTSRCYQNMFVYCTNLT